MSTVFLRQMRLFWTEKKSWILSALLLLGNGVFMTIYHFYFGVSRYEVILGTLLLITVCLLPVVILPQWKKGKEDRFLQLLPLTGGQILWGKLLADVAILGIFTAMLGVWPPLLSLFGGGKVLSAYVALLCFFLGGLVFLFFFVMVGMAVGNRFLAYGISYLFVVLTFVLARLAEASHTAVGAVGRFLSFFGVLAPFSYGIFDWRILPYYVGAAALFLTLIILLWASGTKDRTMVRRSMGAGALAVILLGTTLGACFLPAQAIYVDLNENKASETTQNTQAFLGKLAEDVTIYLLEDDEGTDAVDNDRRFGYFLDKYASHSEHLTVERLRISESGAMLAELGLSTADVHSYCMIIESDRRSEILDYRSYITFEHQNSDLYSMGLPYQMSYSDYSYYGSAFQSLVSEDPTTYTELYYAFISDVDPYFSGENYLNAAIEYVVADLIPTKYVLTGHGEASLSGTAMSSVFGTYSTLNLAAGGGVPADAASISVFAPAEDLSDGDVIMLRNYLNQGGTVNVIINEANLKMPNLMSFLEEFGLMPCVGILYEDEEVTEENEDGEEITTVKRTDAIKVTPNTDHDVLAALESLSTEDSEITYRVTRAIPIKFTEKNEDSSLITTALLTTSDQVFFADESHLTASYVVGAVAENNRGAKLTLFTGAEGYLMDSESVSEDLSFAYALFCPYLASEWTELVYQTNLATAPSTLYEEPYLAVTEMATVVFGVIAILIIPGTLVTVGMIRLYKRKKA